MNNETVASITTPIGEGGIGVIQVSGPRSLEIVNSIFRGKKKNKDLRKAESKRLYYGEIYVNEATVDEVIINVFRKSDSFTGEDLVEVNCHGGIRAVKKTLECIVSSGAKEVHWNELARRSFMNSKIDVIQEEALREIPQAKTKLGAKVLLDQYNGSLSSFINNLIEKLEQKDDIKQQVYHIHDKLEEILETSTFGYAITSPQRLIITGKPNAGKSTLINTLLGEDRSIVHSRPGTTRDAVDSVISIGGIPLTIVDTAGIRETNHKVEKLGVSESKKQLRKADKIIFMLDNSRPVEKEDKEILGLILDNLAIDNTNNNYHTTPVVTVINKIDLHSKLDPAALGTKRLGPICRISASKGDGISELEENLIVEFKKYTGYIAKKPVIFTKRQQKYLSEALHISKQCISLIVEGKDLNEYSNLVNAVSQDLLNCMKQTKIN